MYHLRNTDRGISQLIGDTIMSMPPIATPPAFIGSIFSFGLELIFYVMLLIFTGYTVVLAYHWFNYGSNQTLSMATLAIYLLGSMPLILVMAITF